MTAAMLRSAAAACFIAAICATPASSYEIAQAPAAPAEQAAPAAAPATPAPASETPKAATPAADRLGGAAAAPPSATAKPQQAAKPAPVVRPATARPAPRRVAYRSRTARVAYYMPAVRPAPVAQCSGVWCGRLFSMIMLGVGF